MNQRRRLQLEEILTTLTAGPAGAARSLRQVLSDDPTLLRDLETCLDEDDDDIGSSPKASEHPSTLGDAEPGRRIGPYRVVRLLARGGMGVVYEAVREDDFEQRVALKLVDPRLEQTEILARFFVERQILADLQHPNIARLLDGGSTDDAMPYFAMEFVEGVPIDRYCDEHELSVVARLELFRQVCQAVQFAHQSLVVHRDLKPGNILVTQEGVPKLLDFGIAKILQSDALRLPRAMDTMPESHPMTPGYASPEQFLGRAVTTGSDIYSLGVLLYKLMSRQLPYRLSGLSFKQLIDVVCQSDPSLPSSCVQSQRLALADREGHERRRLRRLERRLSGDIDAIVMKAMRNEPEYRYGSAAHLELDIRRYLEGLPVEAHHGHGLYRVGKLIRRNKLAFFVLWMILAFGATSTLLWRQAVDERGRAEEARQLADLAKATAVDERNQAERARTRAESVSSFLEELFKSANPDATQGASVPVREVLDRGRQKIAEDLAADPEIRARLSGTLGTVYYNLGLYGEARELREEALQLWRSASEGDKAELAVAINNLAGFHYEVGDYPRAEELSREALAMWQRLGDASEASVTMLNLAAILTNRGQYDEALGLQRNVLEIRREQYGPDDPKVASSCNSLGYLQYVRGNLESAEALFRQALAIYTRAHGDEHTRVASVLGSLGLVLHGQGRNLEALGVFEKALVIRRQLLGDEHSRVANTRKNLAAVLLDLGHIQRAGELLELALGSLRAQKPAGDWTVADAESIWGSYLATVGRLAEAERHLLESYRDLRDVKGEEDIFTRNASQRLGRFYQTQGRLDEAAGYLEPVEPAVEL